MKLTSNKALEILEELRNKIKDASFIDHSICVGNTAGIIAKEIELDVDRATTLGYIHDIGKAVGPFVEHDINGFNYIKELGYDEEYANICLTHSYLNNDYKCTAGGIPEGTEFRTQFIRNHEYTIYEKLINLCDLMCKDRVMTIDKRLVDIMIRKGVYDNTVYHINEVYKLKKEFDDKLGYNVYDLFPEIEL